MLVKLNPRFVTKGLLPLLATIALLHPIAMGDFWISGSLPGVGPDEGPKLFRENLELKTQTLEGELSLDSGGNFNQRFDGGPGLFSLVFPGDRKISLAIDKGQRVVIQNERKDHGALKIAGSPDTDALIAYESFRKESLARLVYPPRAALNEATARGASAERLAALSEQEVEGYAAHRRELNDFTIEQIGKSVALYATSLRWDPDYRLSELESAVKAFSEKHPQAVISKRMIEKVQSFRRTAIGAKEPPRRPIPGRQIPSARGFQGPVRTGGLLGILVRALPCRKPALHTAPRQAFHRQLHHFRHKSR